MTDKLLATLKTKGWKNLRTEQLRALLFTLGLTVSAVFLFPDTDVARGTNRSRGLILALGNTDIQAGMAWLSAIVIAFCLAATVIRLRIEQKQFAKNDKDTSNGR